MIFRKQKDTESSIITAHNGMELDLSEVYYVDGGLTERDPLQLSVYHSLETAVSEAENGTPEQPFRIYIEPGMYMLSGSEESSGLTIPWDYIELIGLGDDPSAVVIADNRGLNAGCSAHSETVEVIGTHFTARNLTFLNFCNCDYPYIQNPACNQRKRTEAITRAHCIAASPEHKPDYFTFDNVQFIGMEETVMLRTVPHILFQNCYLQGTTAFIGGGDMHVFENCTIRCFGNEPLYQAGKNGSAFLNCTWKIDFAEPDNLYLAHHNSPVFLEQCKFESTDNMLKEIYWCRYPKPGTTCLCGKITKNNAPVSILPGNCCLTLTERQRKNLTVSHLLGTDKKASPEPIHISISDSVTMTAGDTGCYIGAGVFPASANQNLKWNCKNKYLHLSVPEETETIPKSLSGFNSVIRLDGTNPTDHPVCVTVTATAENEIAGFCHVTILPPVLDSPLIIRFPQIRIENGTAILDYELALNNYTDESQIQWYYVNNSEKGNIMAPIDCSHSNKPCRVHRLTYGDAGKYLVASIEPRHNRSKQGRLLQALSPRRISLNDIPGKGIDKYNYETDFSNFPTEWNADCVNGGWILDAVKPADVPYTRQPATDVPWSYGTGICGADRQQGFITAGFGARLLYRVDLNRVKLMVKQSVFDTTLTLCVNPEKTDGSGFDGADGQYLDIFIKYDIDTQTGYGLRIARTAAYSNAAAFSLCSYKDGIATPLAAPYYAAAFTASCTITLMTQTDTLTAQISSSALPTKQQKEAALPTRITLTASIKENYNYSIGLLHTGVIVEGARLQFTKLKVSYTAVTSNSENSQL